MKTKCHKGCVSDSLYRQMTKESSENLPGGEKIKEWGDKQDDYTQVQTVKYLKGWRMLEYLEEEQGLEGFSVFLYEFLNQDLNFKRKKKQPFTVIIPQSTHTVIKGVVMKTKRCS